MIWINNSNTVAINSLVSDGIPAGTTYETSSVSSGFPMPVSAPPGSTNLGVACTDTSAVTVTTLCYYEGPTGAFPRGRVIWAGKLGPDPGATDPANADDEITIPFNLDVDGDTNNVRNRATVDADLNNDGDATDPGEQQVATATATWNRSISKRLPSTGFAPNKVTDLSNVTRETYIQTGGITLDIPSLSIDISIVGVPRRNGDWNVSWLGRQAVPIPGWEQPHHQPCLFTERLARTVRQLEQTAIWDEVLLHAYGQKYTFEVSSNEVVAPYDASAFRHEEKPWLTLVTCREYDEKTNTYHQRVLIRAVLVSVAEE